jgi:uncharacterized membrane protein
MTNLFEDPESMYDALWVVVGILMLLVARRVYGIMVDGSVAAAVLVTQTFVTAIAVVIMAATDIVDLQQYGRWVAAWVLYTLAGVGVLAWLTVEPSLFYSDVSLFESWASQLIIDGQSPFGADMTASLTAWNASIPADITATTTGGVVTRYSYPGGTLVWSTLERVFIDRPRIGLSSLAASIGFGGWLVLRVDRGLVPLALVALLAPIIRPFGAALGMITPLWLWPLAAGLAAWYDDRPGWAAVGIGIAVVSKQLAWPVAGLVAVHILRTRGWRVGGRFVGIAAVCGGLLVLPFIIISPVEWAYSALFPFLPFGPDLVVQGVGLTSISVSGVASVPRELHRLLVLGTAATLIALTWRYPDRVQWLIPFATIITMLVHYRTLPSYYAMAIPLSVVVLDARLQDSRESTITHGIAQLIVWLDPPDLQLPQETDQ